MNRDLHDIQAILERTPRVLNALLRDLPESWTLTNEGGDSWTPVAIVAHYIDSERHNWIPRAQLILESSAPPTFPTFARAGHIAEAEGSLYIRTCRNAVFTIDQSNSGEIGRASCRERV